MVRLSAHTFRIYYIFRFAPGLLLLSLDISVLSGVYPCYNDL